MIKKNISRSSILILLTVLFYFMSSKNYLLFHTLIEFFSIIIASSIFIIALNSREFSKNKHLLFLGVAYVFIGSFDLLHTLSYKGINIISGFDSNLPTQLWILARYTESFSLLFASYLIISKKKFIFQLTFIIYLIFFSFSLFMIFTGLFPDCYIEGKGLTLFKKLSELLISIILLFSLWRYYKLKTHFHLNVRRMLYISIIFTIFSEIFFTFYVSVFGLSNFIGHIFKVISFYYIYRALIVSCLKDPYNNLFKSLQLSKIRYRNAQRIGHVGNWEYNLQTNEFWGSDEAKRIYGFDINSSNFTTEEVESCIPEREKVHQALIDLIEQGKKYELEFEIITKDKSESKFIYSIAELEKDNLGNPLKVSGVVSDITERKNIELAFKKNQVEMTSLIENAPICIKKVDLDFNLQFMSKSGVDELKVGDVNKFYNKPYPFYFFPDPFRTIMSDKLKEVKHEGKTIQIDGVLSDIKGKEMFYTHILAPVKKNNQNIDYILILSMDITMRKKAEMQLKDSNRRMKLATDSAGIGVWDLDLENDRLVWDERMYEMYGVDPNHFEKAYFAWQKGVHPDDLEKASNEVNLAIKGEKEFESEFRIVRPDGEIRYLKANGIVIKDDFGKPLRMIGINIDITEQKNSEAELIKMEKLSSIGTLAGGIAHDFNNILTVIYGNISFLKMGLDENHEYYDVLEDVEGSIIRAKKLSNQLLTFAKGGAPVKKEVNMTKLIKDTILFDLSGSHLKPVFDLTENDYYAKIDEGQIAQVFSNLAINASQASPKSNNLYISLRTCSVSENEIVSLKTGKYLKITVRDQGKGISKENLLKIFDPYFTTKETGNGLGLATVYSIIRKHNGTINVDSELGQGTTFTIYLPALSKNNSSFNKNRIKKEIDTLNKHNKKKILIMDDEAAICKLLSRFIKHLGYDYETVSDGEQAIEKYKESLKENNPYDIIIMDLTIPGGMGGKEALKEVLKVNKEAKVIVSSGYSSEESKAEYRSLGFIDMLDKPYTMEKIEEVIYRVLQN